MRQIFNRQRRSGLTEEGIGQGVEGKNDQSTGENTSNGSAHTRLGLDGGTREGSGSGIGVEQGTNAVGDTDGDEFLVRVDLVAVQTSESWREGFRQSRGKRPNCNLGGTLTLSNRNVLKKHDDRCDGKLGSQRLEQAVIDSGATDVLETTRDSLQDGDREVALGVFSRLAVEPGTEGEDKDDECVAGRADEEERPCAVGIALGESLATDLDEVEGEKSEHSESRIASGMREVLEGVDDNAVGRVTCVETAGDTKQTRNLGGGDGDGGTSHEPSNTKRVNWHVSVPKYCSAVQRRLKLTQEH